MFTIWFVNNDCMLPNKAITLGLLLLKLLTMTHI